MQARGFRVCFTPLREVLFTFPSRYSCAIGLSVVFSLAGWAPQIPAEFLVLRGTQVPPRHGPVRSAYGALTLYGGAFQRLPLRTGNGFAGGPTTPGAAAGPPRFGLMRFRSPLLAQSLVYFLFLGVLRCFSSPRSPRRTTAAAPGSLPAGFPIRTPADLRALAPPRGFSQLVASFFASESHRHPPCALVRFTLSSFASAPPPRAPKGRTAAPLDLACIDETSRSILSVNLASFFSLLCVPSMSMIPLEVENNGVEPPPSSRLAT